MGSHLSGWLLYMQIFYWDTGIYEIKVMPKPFPMYGMCHTMIVREKEGLRDGLAQFLSNSGHDSFTILETGCLIKEKFDIDKKERVLIHTYAKIKGDKT